MRQKHIFLRMTSTHGAFIPPDDDYEINIYDIFGNIFRFLGRDK